MAIKSLLVDMQLGKQKCTKWGHMYMYMCIFVPEYKYFCPCVIFFKCIHPLSSAYLYQGHGRGWASIPAVLGKDAGYTTVRSILPHVSRVRLHANSDGGVELRTFLL